MSVISYVPQNLNLNGAYNSYYLKKQKLIVIDKGIPYSQLKAKYNNNYQAMADEFCIRANEIGDLYRNKKQ